MSHVETKKLGSAAMVAAVLALIVSLVWPVWSGAAGTNTTYSFTSATAAGWQGPTQAQINTAYSGTDLAGDVAIATQGVQEWTVPTTGRYRFTVVGAHGAVGQNTISAIRGGRGAYITAEKDLTAGQKLYIVVGQAGSTYFGSAAAEGGGPPYKSSRNYGGGGGASFVAVDSRQQTDNLLVAGGGGGSANTNNTPGLVSGDANTDAWGLTNGSAYASSNIVPTFNNTSDTSYPIGASIDKASLDLEKVACGGNECGFAKLGFGGVANDRANAGAGWFGDGHRSLNEFSGHARAAQLGGSSSPVGGFGGVAGSSHGGFGGGGFAGSGVNGGGGGGGGFTGGDGGALGGGGGSYASGFTSSQISVDVRAFMRGSQTPVHGYVDVAFIGGVPTVSTTAAAEVTTTAATVGGNVTADGGLTVSARGVVWDTTPNPLIDGADVTQVPAALGDGTGTFTVSLSGLSPGTTYYVRAYAINSMGTAYGAEQSFTTVKLDQTVTFADVLPSPTFGDAPFTVSPTTDANGLTPSLSASPGAVCAVTGPNGQGAFTVTIVGGGICTLTASQGGNTTYNAATPVARSFTVALAAQTITFPMVSTLTFAPSVRTLEATADSNLTVTFTSDTPTVCTVAGVDLTTLREGECTLVASQAGNDNYLPAESVTRSFTVERAAQTFTLTDTPQRTYGDTAFAPTTVTSSGVGLTPVLTSTTADICTTDGVNVTLLASGSCVLDANEDGDDRYLPAAGQLQIAVARRELTITGTIATESRVYDGTTEATVSAGTNLNLNGVLAADTNDVTLNPTLEFADREAGTHTVRVSGDSPLTGDRAEHYVLSVVGGPTATATISQRPLTVTSQTGVTRPYDGTTAVDLPACEAYGLSNVVLQDAVTLTCPSSGTAQAVTVGTHQLTPVSLFRLTGADATNYTITQPNLTAVITKASARAWFTGGLVQVLQSDGSGIALPSVTLNPASAGTLNRVWHDGAAPSVPGRYRVDVTLDSQTHQAEPLAAFVSVIAAQSLPPGMTPPTIGPLVPTDEGEPGTPDLPPSDATIRKNDQPIIPTVTPADPDLTVQDNDVSLTFRARGQAAADPRPLGAELDLVLLAGGVLDVTGSGFKPNSHAEVWIFSDPQLMGVVNVDANGDFVAQLDVPSSLSAGEHVLQVNGTTSNDLLGSFSLGVLVEVPTSDNAITPLRSGTGQPFTAPAGGPAALMAGRHLDVSVTVAGPRQVLGGTPQTLTINSNDPVNAFVVRVIPQPNGQVGLIVDHSVVLSRGATLAGSVEGFAPFTSVQVWMLSEPRQLGRVITNGDGAADVRISMPQDVAYGLHTLQFVATTRTGQPVGVAVGLWVTKDRPPFVDVSLAATHGAAIATLAVHDHVAGFTDGRYRPNMAVSDTQAITMMSALFGEHFDADAVTATGGRLTRGDAAKLVAQLFTLPSGQDTDPFYDVTGADEQAALSVLYAHGLVTGFANGSFRPTELVTRAQFASLIVHAQAQLARV